MSNRLDKKHFVMNRPYSGRAIFYNMLRENGEVNIAAYQKEVKKNNRKITALHRIIYRVGKYVEEYGYDLEVTPDPKTGEPKVVSLIKAEGGPKKPSKPGRSKSKAKPEKKAVSKKTAKSKAKPSKKAAKPAKKSKKAESESESESAAESESASESVDESSELES